jgi:aspartate carbamoyltransferase catalytic subunit
MLNSVKTLACIDITREDIELIFETADNFKDVINRPIKSPSLRDVTIANVFLKTQRTRLSFDWLKKIVSGCDKLFGFE